MHLVWSVNLLLEVVTWSPLAINSPVQFMQIQVKKKRRVGVNYWKLVLAACII